MQVQRGCALNLIIPLTSLFYALSSLPASANPADIDSTKPLVIYAGAKEIPAATLKDAGLAALQLSGAAHYNLPNLTALNPSNKEHHQYPGQEPAQELLDACREIMLQQPNLLCEPNYVYTQTGGLLPDDPSWETNWGLYMINAPSAWSVATGSRQVKVAVIDSGVDYNHPDIYANIAVNNGEIPGNGIDDDNNGYIDDYYGYDFVDQDRDPSDPNGHGTHVAGVIGAAANNGFGTAGVSWQVGIIPIRVINAAGAGTLSNITAGIEYALSRGAHIINLSLGGPHASLIFKAVLERTALQGVLVVAAAANDSTDLDRQPSYPASFKLANMLSVAASDWGDNLAPFSNFGPATVHLTAPGTGIFSLIPGGEFGYFSGTSMAAPHVSGTAALLKSLHPAYDAQNLKQLMLETVDLSPAFQHKTISGGRLNAGAALALATQPGMQLPPDKPSRQDRPANDEAKFLGLRLRTARQTAQAAKLTGRVFDLRTGQGLPGKASTLFCNNTPVRAVTSLNAGRLLFGKIRRPQRGALKCYASNGVNSSKMVRIQKKEKRAGLPFLRPRD